MSDTPRRFLPGTRTPDLTNLTFGLLRVLDFAGRDAHGRARWHCQCECGGEAVSEAYNLKSGNTTSCGCVHRERVLAASRTHGQKGSPLYQRWKGMKQRTSDPNDKQFADYGGRGIKVCERWMSFERFAADMGPTFREGLSLERIDVDGDYSPGNCTWITIAEQQRNKRTTIRVTFRGQTKPLVEWCELLGLNPKSVRQRIRRRGWPIERALTVGADPDALARLAAPDDADFTGGE